MTTKEPLVLHYEKLSQRAEALFREMNKSSALPELFLKDPTAVVTEKMLIGYRKPLIIQIHQVYRLLFSLLSNPKFMEWSKQFQVKMETPTQEMTESEDPIVALKRLAIRRDRMKLYQEIAEAALNLSDLETMYSLLSVGSDQSSDFASELRESILAWNEPPAHGNVHVQPVTDIGVAVLLIAALMAGITDEPSPLELSRQDLLGISTLLKERLVVRAQQVQEAKS